MVVSMGEMMGDQSAVLLGILMEPLMVVSMGEMMGDQSVVLLGILLGWRSVV
jgi:hypothetical protein